MQVKSNHSINNIFDVDNNIEDITYNNQTYSNGFGIEQFKSRNNKKIYYIKKRIKPNISPTNKNNLTQIEPHNMLFPGQIYQDSDIIPQQFKIETMPLDFNKYKSKEKKEADDRNSLQICNKKIYIRKKNSNNFVKKRANKKLSGSTIDEINISLKNLKIKPFKPKNNNNMISFKRNEYGSYKLVKNLNSFNNTDSSNNNSINNGNNTINPYIKRYAFQENDNLQKKKIFGNLDIQNESRFSYISNSHNNKIIFLQKLIYQQKNNLKSLREQNKNLLDKVKILQEKSKSSLDIKTNLKEDIKTRDKDDKNKKDENHKSDLKLNVKNETKDRFISIEEIKNDLKQKEKNVNEVKIIYCLYDKNNLLSYDFTNNEFKLKPIDNQDFQNSYNKDINTLLLHNYLSNKLYIIAGPNNDQLFIYDLNKEKFQKYSKLKNNHMFGGLLNLKKNIICLSGKFNKKVEIYNESNDKWDDRTFEELPEERAHTYYLLLNNKYIYGFYGYNYILNEYLNNIVYYDLDKNIWGTIMDNSLDNNNKGIKNHFCYQNMNNKLINILGGDSNYGIITIDLEKKIIIKTDENKEDKTYDIFLVNNNSGYNIKNDSLTLFDQNYNIHIFNDLSNQYEIIKYIDKNLLNIDNI